MKEKTFYTASRKSIHTQESARAFDQNIILGAIIEYRSIYKRNSCRIDRNKFWLLSIQIRTLLLIMLLEKYREENKCIKEFSYVLNYSSSEKFRNDLKNNVVMDFNLETIFFICDYLGVELNIIKKRALDDILVNLGEQRDKNEYEKFNKLYSNN